MITGRCKCGGVRYEGKRCGAPTFRCYCRDCQQLTGTGHAEMVPLTAASFRFSSVTSEYRMIGGSGRPTWSNFCPNCGSPLARRSERMSDRVYVHAASMDEPANYKPSHTIYASAAQPWDEPVSDGSGSMAHKREIAATEGDDRN